MITHNEKNILAVECTDSSNGWYYYKQSVLTSRTSTSDRWHKVSGKLHRENGPAIILHDGTKMWYRCGKLHREDGPAREYPDGSKEWYRDGLLHREDGPAVEYAVGINYWYLNGKSISFAEFLLQIKDPIKKTMMALQFNPNTSGGN